MGFNENLNGGFNLKSLSDGIKDNAPLIIIIGVSILATVLIILLIVNIAGIKSVKIVKDKEGFRHLLINRMKLTNQGANQSGGCAALNRGTRVTNGAWAGLMGSKFNYQNKPTINNNLIDDYIEGDIETNGSNQFAKQQPINNGNTVFNQIEESNSQIESPNKVEETNPNINEIQKLLNTVKDEIDENSTTIPNSTTDPLDTSNVITEYVTGNMIDGNREPFIRHGPIEREEFMTRTDKCNYSWMYGADKVMHNTDPKKQLSMEMQRYAAQNNIKV